ncbi:hypothetical protein AMTRI_Chr01g110850 [Amborella trichopoda]
MAMASDKAGSDASSEGNQATSEQRGSVDELRRYRQAMRQNSMEAIMAAEAHYAKAKYHAASTKSEAQNTASHAGGSALQYAVVVKDKAMALGADVGATAVDKGRSAGEYVGQKACEARDRAADVGMAAGRCVKGYGAQKAGDAKEYAGKVKDYVVGIVGGAAKELAVEEAKEYAKDGEAKDTARSAQESVTGYTRQRASQAKETVAERAQASQVKFKEPTTVSREEKPQQNVDRVTEEHKDQHAKEEAKEWTSSRKSHEHKRHEAGEQQKQVSPPSGTTEANKKWSPNHLSSYEREYIGGPLAE